MDKELKILILSALLHRIGIFAKRANRPFSKKSNEQQDKNDKPNSEQSYMAYSYYFIENDLPLPWELERDRSTIAEISAGYYSSEGKSLPKMSIMIADQLASGVDRL